MLCGRNNGISGSGLFLELHMYVEQQRVEKNGYLRGAGGLNKPFFSASEMSAQISANHYFQK